MSRKNLRTNMTPEESKYYLGQFWSEYISNEEEEYISGIFTQHLFYETWGRKDFRECVCTRCGCGRFEVTKDDHPGFFQHSHGDYVTCPSCGQEVHLVALGKMTTFATLAEERRVTICRVAEDGALLLVSGWAKKDYAYDDLRPIVWFNEKMRTCFRPGKRMQWVKLKAWDGNRYRDAGWTEKETVSEPFSPYMWTSDGSYSFIFPERIRDSAMKYCQLEQWYQDVCSVDLLDMAEPVRHVISYLSAYTEYPVIEMAVKIGFSDAVEDLVTASVKNARVLNWSASSPYEFMRMDKADGKSFLRNSLGLPQLKVYEELRKQKFVTSVEEYLDFVIQCGGPGAVVAIGECAARAGISMRKALNYAKRQCEDIGILRVAKIWIDYLELARQLSYDLEKEDVLMPKNLIERHDAASATIKAQTMAEKLKAYKRRLKLLKKIYEFQLDGMCIVIPESAQDIVLEGKNLQHCVGGYADRHVAGKVDILFLRKLDAPARSYITIEMSPRGSIADKVDLRQIHGFRNELRPGSVPPMEKHGDFIRTWMDWLRHGSRRDDKGRPILPAVKEKSA